tara:strand:+ start:1401 stop:1616 length:216 start_codon:yes stop_codon:yes gene_type:complete
MYEEIERMIIYEIICSNLAEDVSVFLSNMRKASSFVAKNKKLFDECNIKKHVVANNKCEIIKFLNRENGIG